jgi:hypothetical protein
MEPPEKITLHAWDARYAELKDQGLREKAYGGPLSRHVADGDLRLRHLSFDDSPAALRLWNFLLTEEERLHEAKKAGKKIVGAMKDLGTVPVMAYSSPRITAFYPDGAWWIPCVMELSAGLLSIADSLGMDESFCPVRAMLGAFVNQCHYPIPDLLLCNVGAVCDDFSAIAQRLESLGHPIFWWESPHRRRPDPGEKAIRLPGGFTAPEKQVRFVQAELERIRCALQSLTGDPLEEVDLDQGIREANRVRRLLKELRFAAYTAPACPMPALEMLIAEMLAIHFCSDRNESMEVLTDLLIEVKRRRSAGIGVLAEDAVRFFWVNPVADLRVMNLLEECGGRICGTEYLFSHALDEIPEDLPPMEALARMALADPMTGPASDRAERIVGEIRAFNAEAVIVSRIPGASHCALEGEIIREKALKEAGVPGIEVEVPPVSDAFFPTLRTRMEALMETVKRSRKG